MSPLKLNDNHRNTLRAGFKYIDALLADGLAAVSSGDEGAVFSPVFADATPVQRKVIADQTARLRRAVRAAMAACEIPLRPPEVSALWDLRSHLISIQIALDELGTAHLRGYGAIDDADAAGVAAQLAQIRAVAVELEDYLAAGFGGDLSARLARLDGTRDEVRLLREMERIVAAHGLVVFRQPLEHLLERLERNWWTVAFVGRVSCGKSSLLNFLLETDVLPSGVTPVTAVPVRITGGPEARAVVSFAGGKPERIPAERLAEFASEERNPGNMRHVTDIHLELPAARLEGDVCFVDTPGLGSLATGGAAQTLAFLPRCDAGVVMIDATSTPTREDIAVVRSLLEGGAEVLPVVSKSDLLTPADLDRVRDYFVRQLREELGGELPVAPVSVVPAHRGMTEAWWLETLAPLQARHRELAGVALRRKAGATREALVAALSRRAGNRIEGTTAPDAHARLGAARAAIEEARRKAYDIALDTTPPAEEILGNAAAALSATGADGDQQSALARELGRAAADLAAHFDSLADETRGIAGEALTAAVTGGRPDHAGLIRRSQRPLFDPAPVVSAGTISDSWRRWPTAGVRRAALRRALRSQFSSALDEALRHYGHALAGWTQRYLDDLAAQFNARAGLIEAAVAPVGPSGKTPAGLARDLELLRNWDGAPVE